MCERVQVCGQDTLRLIQGVIQVPIQSSTEGLGSAHLFAKLPQRPELEPRGPEGLQLPGVCQAGLRKTAWDSVPLEQISGWPAQVSGCPKTTTHFLFPNLGPLFLIGGRRSKASARSWPRQAGHFSPQDPPSLVPAMLQLVVVFLLRSRPGALHKGRTYLQQGWSCGLGWRGPPRLPTCALQGYARGEASLFPQPLWHSPRLCSLSPR